MSSNEWEEINLSALKTKLWKRITNEQYAPTHDPDNKSAAYFRYMEKEFDCAREKVKVAMKASNDEEVDKEFRRQFKESVKLFGPIVKHFRTSGVKSINTNMPLKAIWLKQSIELTWQTIPRLLKTLQLALVASTKKVSWVSLLNINRV